MRRESGGSSGAMRASRKTTSGASRNKNSRFRHRPGWDEEPAHAARKDAKAATKQEIQAVKRVRDVTL